MKSKIFAITVIAATAAAQQATASDGTINFNGELVSQTCTINVNGTPTPAAATVTLPTISSSLLSAAGQTAGQTSFNIQLSNCTGAASTAAAFFEAGATVDPTSGLLKNSGTATNVALELVDSVSNAAIVAGDSAQTVSTSRIDIDPAGNTNMPYAVRYKAQGAATAGTVVSSVTYSIDYQ